MERTNLSDKYILMGFDEIPDEDKEYFRESYEKASKGHPYPEYLVVYPVTDTDWVWLTDLG